TAVATDTSGNTATSAAVTIIVNNAANTSPTVSITAPANDTIVGGTITVSASVTDNVGIASVQFLLDGADLGSKVTSAPYSVLWNTTLASNGSHALAAQATDLAGHTTTSSNVSVTVSQSGSQPPPPPPVGDDITISETSGLAQTNRPVSIARPFAQGEIANFAQASIGGTALLTQCDVKNRWPDGSLKFAVVSFVVPSLLANGSVVVSFSNQATGNNTSPLTPSEMLGSAYNFEGQIQLAGAVSHNISARAMLTAAGSTCADGTETDPDGTITANLCTYWLEGPIVTAVILEDRSGRTFDVNTDGGTGNPLHPRFEAWFYPQTNQVQLGYTLENDWASTTATSSARDQAVTGVKLTGGNTNPVTEFNNSAFSLLTRTMIHKTYCINGTNAGSQFDCIGSTMHIDHNLGYLANTKTIPHYDTTMTMLPAAIAGEYSGLFSNTSALVLQGCAGCVGGGGGIGYYPNALDATGASPFHGLMPTWDVEYLMTQCDAGNSTSAVCGNGSAGDLRSVMLTNADLAGRIPYWFREADTNAGHGQTFDNSGIAGNVQTLGRVVSINARTQISLFDVTETVNQCNTNYTADYINYGGSGQDIGAWNGDQDTSHWPNIALASYLTTGQYQYYEMQMMQSANALGNFPGTRACTQPTQNGTLRMGSLGYWYLGDERGTNWLKRENLYGAFFAVDGSPEKAYFLDKLNANLAIEEALHGIPNDIGSEYAAAYAFGQSSRCNGIGYCPATLYGPLGVWNSYSGAYSVDGQITGSFFQTGSGQPIPQSADGNFQAAFSALMVGVAYDMGFTSSALPQYAMKRYIHLTQDPTANIYTLADYVFPTTDVNGNWFTSFSAMVPYYNTYPTNWPGIGGGTCQGGDEPYDLEGLAAFSYGYSFNDAGFSGATGWNLMRSELQPCWSSTNPSIGGFPTDPKWDITPRTSN
ncbi:MAG: Ig-like domain-containing protein, partial [Candidatus Acidiferrum sp.]